MAKLRKDDIVLAKSNYGFRLHRIVLADHAKGLFITKGDCGQQNDPALTADQILGLAWAKEVRVGRTIVEARFRSVGGWILRFAARAQYISAKLLRRAAAITSTASSARTLLIAGLLLSGATFLRAQVAVDATTSASNEFTGSGSFNLNFNHTTTTTANRLLVVGVSMNVTNAPSAGVVGVTYGGAPLSLIGVHNDAANTRRVEMWYLLNPASGTNVAMTVTVNIPTAGARVGVVAGATTLTGVDQTVPLGTFVSDDGAAAGYGQLNPMSVVNGMIIDTMAVGGNVTATPYGPQVQQWNAATASGTDPPAVRAFGSSRTGAPSVPLAGTFSANSNWSYGAIPINPSTADIGVSTSVSAVQLGQNSTYTITITNNGPSPANNVTLTDTYNATNLSLVSYNASSGTSCTNTATTVNCTLPTPFASGATATVSVVVSTSAAGFYPNTATITDSGTPPDPNTGNNTYVALAPVVSVVCGTNTIGPGGTLTGTINTYWPGNGNVAAGATSIPLGTANGAGTIAAGSLLLVVQMQDAGINTSNSVQYGNGSTGQGFTTINNAGNYEFVTATGPIAGGSVPIKGAGAGAGLVFGYTSAAASATKGISTYQVVLVPQYTSATLGALTAASWNGSTGGIIALDVAGQLNLGGATVSVDGMGFRGGAGMQLTGNAAGTNTDYQFAGPANYTGAAEAGVDAAKGEGVAGTSKFVEYNSTYVRTINGVGYPSGTAGTDGSMARGAPGNAGAGGTDSRSSANDQNAGGGGGGNGGAGGFGGDSWNTNLSSGGEGGTPFPATIDRLAMGGGGGAGTRNNSDGDNLASSGSSGGGIIFIRADSLTGTATLTANGAPAYNLTANDAGGGGGAGGTIVILSANGGESGLTLQANGGTGGNAWSTDPYSLADRHGPGGGGGGGVIFVSGAPASTSVNGGASGLTLNPGVPYGSTAGTSGTVATGAVLSQVTGIQSSSLCTPDLTITKTHVGNFTRGSAASYTITVSNVSPYGATTGLVTIDDTMPLGISPTGASGTGWTCSISGQTVSCTRSDALTAGATYPTITVNALVAQSAPATLTNIATVSGGGEANLTNDTATDVAIVLSSADLAISDVGSPNPVAAGSNITYTIVATNNGPSAADNATLVVPIPANTTFASLITPTGWTCATPTTGNTGQVVCTNVDMMGLTAGTFTLAVKVNTGVANGTVITDTATIGSSVIDPIVGNNSATVNIVVGTTGPNLSVTNTASPNPVQAGSNITYTQVVTNTGSSAITNGTFTEATPLNTAFVSITPPAGWNCTGFPGSPCTATTVAAGASGIFTVVYKVNVGTGSGTVITDTATVNASNQSFGANAATATDVVASGTQADVSLSTTFTPNAVLAGNSITYTQTITNNGPAAASGLSFTEATPANTTFQSVLAPNGWTCTTPAVGATGTVNCTNSASLASGNSANIVVVVNVPASFLGGNITANSSISATTSDPNLGNNSTTVQTGASDNCDLAVTNSGTPSPVTAGSNITYTQVISNSGPSNCSAGTLSEATPANTTFVSVAVVNANGATWSCPNTAPVACIGGSVPPGSTGTITAIYTVNAGTTSGTIIADTVTVASSTSDTNSANNTATSNIAVTAAAGPADLSITNVGSINPVIAGNTITYTQTVTNHGPSRANRPTVTETLPTGTTAVSLTGPAGWTCNVGTLSCRANANMPANTTAASFTFTVTVPSTIPSGTNLTQTAAVSSTTTDPNLGNNSATVSTLVSTSADLSVTNTPAPVPVQAGNNITYTQVVTNAGPSTATGVSLTETLPANTTVVSLTAPAGWTCNLGTLTCGIGTLAPSTPATITYVLKVTAGTAAGTAINETASVSSSVTDPNSANNTATAADVVATATQADLVATNVATPTSVQAGNNVTYTQTVKNLGPAAAAGATFTQVTPPNTTFVSMAGPGGTWTCTNPGAGNTGTVTCSDSANLALNATASFTLVLQVAPGTPSGTNITDTVTANATNIVPNLTGNSASATVVVANANSADMAIVKTATPDPVTQGTPLTYTLTVTNNGPSSATNVMVTDTLPSSVTYLSSTSTLGTCSEAGGTVTCQLGTMANADTETISILTIPQQAGIITNTATVAADQTDSNPNNNTSSVDVTVLLPTSITLLSFDGHYGADQTGARRVVLTWKTGGEAHNLGFNLYREINGTKVRTNPSLIAGSALMMSGALPKHSGRSYSWIDPSNVAGATYWLEDVDTNGARTMHGPISISAPEQASAVPAAQARTLNQISEAQSTTGMQESHMVERFARVAGASRAQFEKQYELAARPAVKIYVQHEGWHHVSQPDLVKAGLDPNVDPATLHLFAEAIEQPLQITGATAGPGGFGPSAGINFYGTAINTPYSGNRVYWLMSADNAGLRIPQLAPSSSSNQPPTDYLATVELQQHTIYFGALITTNGENFFGALVSPTPVDQVLGLPHLDSNSTLSTRLEISLQGIITAYPHDVLVAVNGTNVGDIIFTGQAKGTLNITLPPGVAVPWNNTVTLTAQNGDYDTSLVDYIRITYPHKYEADSDELKFIGRAGDEIQVTNFTSAPVVLDITDPNRPMQLTPQVKPNNGKYDIAVQVPFTTGSGSGSRHTLLAVGTDRVLTPAVSNHHPSQWHKTQPGADILMVTDGDFTGLLTPLVRAHTQHGKSSLAIPVAQLYDEFNFGEHSPFALKRFLQNATRNWKKAPSYLLLNGRASMDPRNYLGLGNLDLVPTMIVPTSSMMTASDDWFSDFSNTGVPTIATGRLPVSTTAEASTVIGKISTYEGKSTNGPWTANALFVADKDDSENFTQDSLDVQSKLPASMQPTDVFVDTVGTSAARTDIINSINSGQLLVNYLGHGSELQWAGSDIFDETTANSLTNGSQLPVFLIMDCLNGFFQDAYGEPLGVTLLLAPNGGGVAVIASSGLNQAPPQTALDSLIVQNAFTSTGQTLGDAILKAKSNIADPDVRRTFVLLGDPAMQLKTPTQSH
ncbi:MAG TPA: C25 family cysteine peptidase [Candidatus Sulfotelmatobacter sp.]|nr:C25 family cysteine peptidase [Candidatus Sulfotelmatobacter sp.]